MSAAQNVMKLQQCTKTLYWNTEAGGPDKVQVYNEGCGFVFVGIPQRTIEMEKRMASTAELWAASGHGLEHDRLHVGDDGPSFGIDNTHVGLLHYHTGRRSNIMKVTFQLVEAVCGQQGVNKLRTNMTKLGCDPRTYVKYGTTLCIGAPQGKVMDMYSRRGEPTVHEGVGLGPGRQQVLDLVFTLQSYVTRAVQMESHPANEATRLEAIARGLTPVTYTASRLLGMMTCFGTEDTSIFGKNTPAAVQERDVIPWAFWKLVMDMKVPFRQNMDERPLESSHVHMSQGFTYQTRGVGHDDNVGAKQSTMISQVLQFMYRMKALESETKARNPASMQKRSEERAKKLMDAFWEDYDINDNMIIPHVVGDLPWQVTQAALDSALGDEQGNPGVRLRHNIAKLLHAGKAVLKSDLNARKRTTAAVECLRVWKVSFKSNDKTCEFERRNGLEITVKCNCENGRLIVRIKAGVAGTFPGAIPPEGQAVEYIYTPEHVVQWHMEVMDKLAQGESRENDPPGYEFIQAVVPITFAPSVDILHLPGLGLHKKISGITTKVTICPGSTILVKKPLDLRSRKTVMYVGTLALPTEEQDTQSEQQIEDDVDAVAQVDMDTAEGDMDMDDDGSSDQDMASRPPSPPTELPCAHAAGSGDAQAPQGAGSGDTGDAQAPQAPQEVDVTDLEVCSTAGARVTLNLGASPRVLSGSTRSTKTADTSCVQRAGANMLPQLILEGDSSLEKVMEAMASASPQLTDRRSDTGIDAPAAYDTDAYEKMTADLAHCCGMPINLAPEATADTARQAALDLALTHNGVSCICGICLSCHGVLVCAATGPNRGRWVKVHELKLGADEVDIPEAHTVVQSATLHAQCDTHNQN